MAKKGPYVVHVVVEGTGRGLLMHKFSTGASASLEQEVKKTKSAHGTPSEEAEQAAYRLATGNGHLGQLMLPAEHFLGAITNAGSGLQVRGKGKATYKKLFKGALDIEPDYIGLTNAKGEGLNTFAIDSRPVKIKATQGRVMRHRPHLTDWRAEFDVIVRNDGIPLEVLEAAIADAGQSQCVGDYRPRYGTFRIVTCERVDEGGAEAESE
jgi:hypothetical protein